MFIHMGLSHYGSELSSAEGKVCFSMSAQYWLSWILYRALYRRDLVFRWENSWGPLHSQKHELVQEIALVSEEQRNFHEFLICSPSDIYPVLGVFLVLAQGPCWRQVEGLNGAMDYSLFLWAQEGSSLCGAVQWVYLGSMDHGRLLQSGNTEPTELDLRSLLGAAGGATLEWPGSLLKHGSAQPWTTHRLQEVFVQCRWYMGRDGWPQAMGDVTLMGDGSVLCVGIKWDSREQTSAADWECWFKEHLFVSAQNILVWYFIFCIHWKAEVFEHSDDSIYCIGQLANEFAKHYLALIFILKCLLSHHYCTKRRTDFTNYKPFLYSLCPEREKLKLLFPKNPNFDYVFVTPVLLEVSRLLHSFQLSEQPSGLLKQIRCQGLLTPSGKSVHF